MPAVRLRVYAPPESVAAVTLAGFVATWTPAIAAFVTESVTTPVIDEFDDEVDLLRDGDGLGTGLGAWEGAGEGLATGVGECAGDGEGLDAGLGECEGDGVGDGTASVITLAARVGIEMATTVARASRPALAKAPSVRRRARRRAEVIDLSAAGTCAPLTYATGANRPPCTRPLPGLFVWT